MPEPTGERDAPDHRTAPGELHLWTLPLEPLPEPLEALEALLAPTEQARAARLLPGGRRSRYIVGRALLRRLLGLYTRSDPRRVPLRVERSGKPSLEGGELHFNLSHSGSLAVVALTDEGCVGVDIESLRALPGAERIAARILSATDVEAVRAREGEARSHEFLRRWTRMEACVKARGEGVWEARNADFSQLSVVEFTPAPGYIGAAATERELRLRFWRWGLTTTQREL
jgi:4'-phosphopantetheinyl transferase